MQAVLPLDSSCEDLEIDSSLSFLDGFVSEALAQGAQAYQPPHLRNNTVVAKPQCKLFLRQRERERNRKGEGERERERERERFVDHNISNKLTISLIHVFELKLETRVHTHTVQLNICSLSSCSDQV